MTVYRGDGWEIREGRWQDSVPESVDVVISDPPYDARAHRNGMRGKCAAELKKAALVASISETHIKGFDPLDDPGKLGRNLLGITKRWVLCFCTIEMVGDFASGVGPTQWIRGGIWVKPDPTPQFSGDRPGVFGDCIAIMHRKGRKRWNGGGHAARWRHATESHFSAKDVRVHPTQKPIGLMLELVRLFSDPGELVWDPYCGSGTTGVACLRLGRRFLGHEMQPRYAKVAAERLAAEERGLTLRDARAGQTSILDLDGVSAG
jgi:site-specific DNA-methyltransferase (adenine-specific)